jgi:outer membrane protein OmpA-like peptidoglycan-associated protein
LHVAGQPSAKWLSDLRARGLFIPGIRALDLGRFTPEQIAFDEARSKIHAAVVRFPLASAALSPAERANLRSLLPQLRDVLSASVNPVGGTMIEVVGHSDTSGAEELNQNLSQRRADRIAWELIQLGIPEKSLHAKGVATAEPVRPEDSEEDREYNRSATFRVKVVAPSRP